MTLPLRASINDVRLRGVTEDDLPIFFEQQRDSAANQMAAFPARDRDTFMTHWANILADESVTVMTILFDVHVAGNIVRWQRDDKQVIGYWIGKDYWGKGVATKALAEFLQIVELRPLFAYVAKRNIASIRVLEKCGFKLCAEETESLDAASDGVDELVFTLDTDEKGHLP
jgi:RimJ/RimL family protein N-acetyltransferase